MSNSGQYPAEGGRSKPTELAITLAALGSQQWQDNDGWLYASHIAANLRRFGFDTQSRALTATLSRMCTVSAPWLERRRSPFNDYEYRVTQFGLTDIANTLRVRAVR